MEKRTIVQMLKKLSFNPWIWIICGTTYLYYMFVIEQVPQPFPLFRIALEQMESYYYL